MPQEQSTWKDYLPTQQKEKLHIYSDRIQGIDSFD